jgi:SAM-dependent methyltransferase
MIWPIGRLPHRSSVIERLDAHDVPDGDLTRLLDFNDTVARWTGGRRIILNFLERASERWAGPVTVLDLSCGRGDLSRAIALWARSASLEVRVHGVERYGRLVQMARDRQRNLPELTFEPRDLNDPFFLQAQQFDYVVSEMGLHREPNDRTALFLKIANRMAKRGLICVDWIRDARPAIALGLLGRLWKSDVVAHDARVAVERGFRYREAEALRKGAGLNYARLRRHVGYRFSLSGERGLVMDPAFTPVTGLAGT